MTPQEPTRRPADAPRTQRLFIAVPLPEDIRKQITGLTQNLQKGFQFTPCRPVWSDPATMHLTLIFLGQTPEEKVRPIIQAMDRLSGGFHPLRIEIKRMGVFPHWRNPRVLWAGIRERTHQLESLQKTIQQAMEAQGYVPEEKEYHAHLTLARFKSLKGVSMVEKLVNDHQGFKFGPFEAPEFILYKSELNPAGARHTPLHVARLSAAPPPRRHEEESENDDD
jgi:2'-5' RNA ligase